MRTWTLHLSNNGGRVNERVAFEDREDVAVIELEPVLDLLERLEDALQTAPDSELGPEPERDVALQDARSLLTAHGRLDG